MIKAIALAAAGTAAALTLSASPASAAASHAPHVQRQHRFSTVMGLECIEYGRHRAVYGPIFGTFAYSPWSHWRVISAALGPCA